MFKIANKKTELDGKSWTKFSVSVWDIAKTKEEIDLGHPAMFPVELCERLIRIYSHPSDIVLDPFLGSGSTLVAAKLLGRGGLGFEINSGYIKLSEKRLKNTTWAAKLKENRTTQQSLLESKNTKISSISNKIPEEANFQIYNENSLNIDRITKPESVNLILTSPPYWDILNQKRTADYKDIRNYSDMEEDIGNMENYEEFMKNLMEIFSKCRAALKKGGHFCIIVMDLRKKEKFYPFHSDIAEGMKNLGFKFEDIIIWNRLREYNNLRSLGYPYVFRVNKVHEYILIFKKV